MQIKFYPGSITGVVMAIAIISGIITCAASGTALLLIHREVERQIDHRITQEAEYLQVHYRAGGLNALRTEVENRELRQPAARKIGYLADISSTDYAMGFLVLDAQGRRLAGSLHAENTAPGWSEFLEFRHPDGTTGVAQALNTELPGGIRLIIAGDRAALQKIDRTLVQIFLVHIALIIAVCVGAAFGVSKYVKHRLNRIQIAADGIVTGDLSRRIPYDRTGSEFDRLSGVLNRMLDRIEALLQNLRQVSGNIAHDMRTPLNRLRNQLEASEDIAEGEVRERLQAAIGDADELLELFSSILAISELEAQAIHDRFVLLNLADVARDIVEAYAANLGAANLTIGLHFTEVWIRGDKRLIQQCLANLLDNVLTHADGASHIDIEAAPRQDKALLRVADNGRGVAAEDCAKIFGRFVRLDQSRSTAGHGLGLSLVSAIAAAHQGTVTAKPLHPGLAVELLLPRAAL